MKILAISGSARLMSTNTALLRALQAVAPEGIEIDVFDGIGDLPIFSADREGVNLPGIVRSFLDRITSSNGLIISSPEYVRSIPGGLKNAIDWLVSGDQIVARPIALVHASHRGDDMLASLRTVLSTVSSNFHEDLFFRLPVMKEEPTAIRHILETSSNQLAREFLLAFRAFIMNVQSGGTVGVD